MPQASPVITGVGKAAAAVGAVKSLTGGGGSAAGQTTTTQQVDPQTQAMQQDLYGRSQQIAQQPFIPYTGPMVAGFSPDQLRQFQATRGLFETGMGFDPTKGLQTLAQEQRPTVAPVGSLLSADIGAYQSPYQQQVIDLTEQDFARRRDLQRQQAEDVAMRAGAFGGSRGTIYEQEALRPLQEQEARTVAGLRQSGFEQAQRAAESDIARQQQMAMLAPELELRGRQQQAGLLGGLLGGQQQALGTLAGFGELGRGLGQAERDFAFGEFMRQQQYPAYQLGLLGQGVSGMPSLIGQTQTTQSSPGLGGILSGATGLLGAGFTGGFFNPLSEKMWGK